MKILHTGDWHIGKLVHGVHMTEDQRYFLYKLIDLLKEEQIDVLIIAGDLYDRSIPPVDAVNLLNEIFSIIINDLKIKIIAISGNHDSGTRLNFGSDILQEKGLYICSKIEKNITPIRIQDTYGTVNFYPLPFAEPAVVKSIYESDSCKTYDDAIQCMLTSIEENYNAEERNVCISHAFVLGDEAPEISDSERPLSIGGQEYVRVSLYKDFDYVALGHLHRPQKVKHDYVRYAGSLLKYSFSEAIQKKSVTIIELNEKGKLEMTQKHINPIRDLKIIEGTLESLIDDANSHLNRDDYICAILTDKGKLFDPVRKLKAVYPNLLNVQRKRPIDNDSPGQKTSAHLKSLSVTELFESFYDHISDEKITVKEKQIFSEIYDEVMKNERGE